MVTLHWGTATDVGRVRTSNEDNYLASGRVFAVADGMGGHAAGEVASALAVSAMAGLAVREVITPEDIIEAITRANESMVSVSRARGHELGMGTTLTGLALGSVDGDAQIVLFNVGDSRIYRLSEGRLSQVTVDHSEVEELVAAGLLTRERAKDYPRRNVVTRSLGTPIPPVPDLWLLPPEPGDRFIICSDGLSGEVDDVEIQRVARANRDPLTAAHELVRLANVNGGSDNVTVVVVDVAAVD